jgi:hypothetical protein
MSEDAKLLEHKETFRSKFFSIDLDDGTASGVLNGCIPVGALVGALISSILIAKFSRRYNTYYKDNAC